MGRYVLANVILLWPVIFSAEREVKDLRRSGMYESTIFDKIGQAKSVVFLFYSAI